jgi:membrane-associated phospholipid phosphatase
MACDPGRINALDRRTAGFWSPAWLVASNVGVVALGAGALSLLTADEGAVDGLNDTAVIAESALSATAFATTFTVIVGRARPFAYGTKAPVSDRQDSDATNSFLSSHSAVAFAIATSTYVAMHRLHPRSQLPYVVLGVGLGTAALVAVSRVMAGQHFITDATGGALIGSSMGLLVPSLHRGPISVAPLVGEHLHGLGIQGSF